MQLINAYICYVILLLYMILSFPRPASVILADRKCPCVIYSKLCPKLSRRHHPPCREKLPGQAVRAQSVSKGTCMHIRIRIRSSTCTHACDYWRMHAYVRARACVHINHKALYGYMYIYIRMHAMSIYTWRDCVSDCAANIRAVWVLTPVVLARLWALSL